MGSRKKTLVGLLCLVAFTVTGCDQLGLGSKKKDTSSKADKDDDDDDDEKSKKKKKSKRDDGDDDKGDGDSKGKDGDKPAAAAGLEVPNVTGFMVPRGGTHKHNDETIGTLRLVIETFSYPLKDFPRDKLRADFSSGATAAGWKCDAKGTAEYDCTKDGALVSVMFGEAGADETKINVFPKSAGAPAAAGDPPPPPAAAGGTVFAGTYSSAWGPVIFTQKASDPTKVLGKYPRGSLVCVPTDNKLECTWAESSGSGRAKFAKDADGHMPGTWGNGGSSASGGQWNLKLTKAGAIE